MKRLRIILPIFLSLIIIYVGAGVSIIEFCNSGCKTKSLTQSTENCCCCKADSDSDSGVTHQKGCCKATVLKVDLMKTTSVSENVFIPVILFIDNYLFVQATESETDISMYARYYPPPEPDTSRFYLNLYSTLLI